MTESERDSGYLEHIQKSIARIQRYTADKSFADFEAEELLQDGVIRNLEILGEAVTKLSPSLKARYLEVPWTDISGMRNRLIHGYMSVNLAIVWATVTRVVPELSEKVNQIHRDLNP